MVSAGLSFPRETDWAAKKNCCRVGWKQTAALSFQSPLETPLVAGIYRIQLSFSTTSLFHPLALNPVKTRVELLGVNKN